MLGDLLPSMPLDLRPMSNPAKKVCSTMNIKHNLLTLTTRLRPLRIIALHLHPLRPHRAPWSSPLPPRPPHSLQILFPQILTDMFCCHSVESFWNRNFFDKAGRRVRYPGCGDSLDVFDFADGCEVDYSPHCGEGLHICAFIGLCFVAVEILLGLFHLEICQ
jgi:hypothetical protein